MMKMKRTARTLDKVFKVLRIALDIALIASLVSLGILAVGLIFDLDLEKIGKFSGSIELGIVELKLTEAYTPEPERMMMSACAELLAALIYICAARIMVGCVRDILKPMTEGKPFGHIVSVKLKKLSVLTLVMGAVAYYVQMTGQVFALALYDLENLLLSEKIAQVTFNYEMDLTFLLIAAAFRLFAYVFRYGEELQKLSDETL